MRSIFYMSSALFCVGVICSMGKVSRGATPRMSCLESDESMLSKDSSFRCPSVGYAQSTAAAILDHERLSAAAHNCPHNSCLSMQLWGSKRVLNPKLSPAACQVRRVIARSSGARHLQHIILKATDALSTVSIGNSCPSHVAR